MVKDRQARCWITGKDVRICEPMTAEYTSHLSLSKKKNKSHTRTDFARVCLSVEPKRARSDTCASQISSRGRIGIVAMDGQVSLHGFGDVDAVLSVLDTALCDILDFGTAANRR